ncbi:hypothetical protein P4534_26775 [Peribacillus butanolivorans]|uniref:hypothetical protein n=1 Tax=Peribacillus butanolivorans TaxID=421767 RepID=UPI002E1A0933|nr:hypothetical protein [Peribacillus butanolivorans]
MKKEKADFLEVNELLNRVEKQHEELRKVTGEGETYQHLTKQKHGPDSKKKERLLNFRKLFFVWIRTKNRKIGQVHERSDN